MKNGICTMAGIVGSTIASFFGGWDKSLATLIIFMAVDYITGLVLAGVFHNSNKTSSGALESRAGWKGLFRKGGTLLIVLVSARLDLLLNTNYVRDMVCIAFIANEAISIIENAGLIGVPIPFVLKESIDILKNKENDIKESIDLLKNKEEDKNE